MRDYVDYPCGCVEERTFFRGDVSARYVARVGRTCAIHKHLERLDPPVIRCPQPMTHALCLQCPAKDAHPHVAALAEHDSYFPNGCSDRDCPKYNPCTEPPMPPHRVSERVKRSAEKTAGRSLTLHARSYAQEQTRVRRALKRLWLTVIRTLFGPPEHTTQARLAALEDDEGLT